jgi:hypothetical protein
MRGELRLLPAFNQPLIPGRAGNAAASLKKEESKPPGRKPTRHHHTELKLNFYNLAVEERLAPLCLYLALSSLRWRISCSAMNYDGVARRDLFYFLRSQDIIQSRRGYFKRFHVEARY